MEPLYSSVIGVAKGVFKAQGLQFTITGGANVPATGGAVMAMNHLSYFDYAYAGWPALEHRRVVRWMAKKEIFDHPVMGPIMRGLKHIPVDRAAGAEAFAEAVKALRGGELVGVFPEATISRSLELKDFKTGAVRMAMEAGVPVLPTVAWGNQRVWTKDHPKQLGRTKIPIFLSVGEPILFAPDEDPLRATEDLKTAMAALLNDVQAAYPALTGDDLKFVPKRLGGTAPTLERALELEQAETADRAAKRAAKAAAKKS